MLCLSAVYNSAGPTCKIAVSLEEDRREENQSCPESLQEYI